MLIQSCKEKRNLFQVLCIISIFLLTVDWILLWPVTFFSSEFVATWKDWSEIRFRSSIPVVSNFFYLKLVMWQKSSFQTYNMLAALNDKEMYARMDNKHKELAEESWKIKLRQWSHVSFLRAHKFRYWFCISIFKNELDKLYFKLCQCVTWPRSFCEDKKWIYLVPSYLQ